MALEPESQSSADRPTVATMSTEPSADAGAVMADAPAQNADGTRRRRDEPFRVHMPVDVRSVSLTILAFAAVLAMLKLAQPVLIPIVVSGLLFYALDPMVDALQRWKVPRALAASLVLLLSVGAVGAGAYALSDDVVAVVDRLPEGVRKLRSDLRRPAPETTFSTMQQTAKELDKAAAEAATASAAPKGVMRVQVEEPPFRASSYLWYGSMGALAVTGQAVMVLFLTFFLLVANDLFKRKLVKHVGETLAKKKVTVQILDEISTQIERFLLVQLLTSAIVGVVTAAALWALGLQQPVVWGLAAGILNTVPYFGPIIVTTGLAIIGYLQFGTLQMGAAVAAVALVITSLEGWLLTPMMLGRVGRLNHIAIFASLLFWSWMWGVWGMLLAVPMLMVMKAICDHVEELQPLADFLSD
jgi:predicted PurR-regulated permease PerM